VSIKQFEATACIEDSRQCRIDSFPMITPWKSAQLQRQLPEAA